MPHEELVGRYFAQDLINEETGEVYFEAGDEITEAALNQLEELGFTELPMLDIDLISRGADSKGPYVRNTLAIDKNATREDALIDIYRVMRPGEPPTLETAETLFNCAVLRRRALRSVGGRPGQDELAARRSTPTTRCGCCASRTSWRSSTCWST